MFAELSITSNFTFLTGASHPEEYMERAALLGYPAIAIADVNSVAGIVRAHSQAQKIARQVKLRQEADIYGPAAPAQEQFYVSAAILNIPRVLPAAQLVLQSGLRATTLCQTRLGWANLCRILSKGRLRAKKGACILDVAAARNRAVARAPLERVCDARCPRPIAHACVCVYVRMQA